MLREGTALSTGGRRRRLALVWFSFTPVLSGTSRIDAVGTAPAASRHDPRHVHGSVRVARSRLGHLPAERLLSRRRARVAPVVRNGPPGAGTDVPDRRRAGSGRPNGSRARSSPRRAAPSRLNVARVAVKYPPYSYVVSSVAKDGGIPSRPHGLERGSGDGRTSSSTSDTGTTASGTSRPSSRSPAPAPRRVRLARDRGRPGLSLLDFLGFRRPARPVHESAAHRRADRGARSRRHGLVRAVHRGGGRLLRRLAGLRARFRGDGAVRRRKGGRVRADEPRLREHVDVALRVQSEVLDGGGSVLGCPDVHRSRPTR